MNDEQPIHYPENPNKFEFDEKVAAIFPNMAERSIPLYRQMHKIQAKILVDDYFEKIKWSGDPNYRVLDIGASRADFYDAIVEEVSGRDVRASHISYTPCDKSTAMVRISADDKRIRFLSYDLADPQDHAFSGSKFDAVIMDYVMQFIPLEHRRLAYQRLADFVKRDGLLLYGEKETLTNTNWRTEKEGRIAHSAHDFYIDFRMQNGYSRDEIEAKTKALKNSMWEVSYESDTKRNLESVGFSPIIPTTRLGVFHSFVAIRGNG